MPALPVKELPLYVPDCSHVDHAPPKGVFDKVIHIAVGVGYSKREFHVHRGLLSHYSIVFQHEMRERCSDEVSFIWLDDEKVEIFETVVYWMYTNRFWPPGTSNDGKIPLPWDTIQELFYFAVRKGMQDLQNSAMTLFFQKSVQEWSFIVAFAAPIYNNTALKSPLRRFIVNYTAETWGFAALEEYREEVPKDFVVDLLLTLTALQKVPGSSSVKADWIQQKKKNFCKEYHDHSANGRPVVTM